jgi:hypothetical protein
MNCALWEWILDDWNDSECVTIFRNCFNALLKSGGKVIAVELELPDLLLQSELGAGSTVALRLDLIMLTHASPGSKERTLHEFRQIAKLPASRACLWPSTFFQCWNSTKHNMICYAQI